jgi:hypothetical protein
MSNPHEKPSEEAGSCPAPGRRRDANTKSQRPRRADRRGDACTPSQLRLYRADSDDAATPIDTASELDAFAGWFADWWLRRGREFTANQSQGAHNE